MAADKLQYASGNSASTTLASGITNSDTSAPLTADTNFNAKSGEGMAIIDEGTAQEELAYATGKVGGSLTIPLANRGLEGGSAQQHSAQATVKGIISAGMWNNVIDALSLLVSKSTGLLNKATAAEVAAGTDDAKIVTPLAAAPYANSSMSRQAIINGNFDVWQRSSSTAITVDGSLFVADRWKDINAKDSGTYPTLTRSRQAHTPGDLDNSYYFTRLATNGAGSSLGVSSYHAYQQLIEHGVRNLSGLNKKVTLSFYARSSIANKRICPTISICYGTGGTPSSQEEVKGTPITLTSSWVKYTATFTLNTLAGKTFGTANDDYLGLNFWLMWGTTSGNTYVQSSVTAETYGGSGNIDIAQVQLCAGEVALPFQPKSFEQELRACQRYYQKSYAYGDVPGTANTNGAVYFNPGSATTNPMYANVWLKVPMRTTPATIHAYDSAGTIDKVYKGAVGKAATVSAAYCNEKSLLIGSTDATSTVAIEFQWTAEAEL
jgi:hypothetical protein